MRAKIDKVTALAALAFYSVIHPAARGADWQYSVGGGVVSAPRSIGSGRQLTLPVPYLEARYRDWFVLNDNPYEGIALSHRWSSAWTLAGSLGLDLDARDPGEDKRLEGLAKVGPTAAARIRIEYEAERFFGSLTLSERLAAADKRGLSVTGELGAHLLTTSHSLVSAGLTTRWVDSDWARNLLSITQPESLRSGLPAFSTKAALLDSGIFGQALYRFNDRWTGFARLELDRLQGDDGDSPVISRHSSLVALLFATRTF